ncbi:hypothetical protein D5S17_25345 [Pseudonocardiaceae bacterium YIM PH 21723]|nr:hypothetical protein D5S17_25345 [Pseudonocardiaceae bacterium YIM PH 21723]
MIPSYPCLTDVLTDLRTRANSWPEAEQIFQDHVLGTVDLVDRMLDDIAACPASARRWITDRSRETSTHFAWCLVNVAEDPFEIWLHEHKPPEDRLPGYGLTVHNHRYDFCTIMLSGGYVHELYSATTHPMGNSIEHVQLKHRSLVGSGDVRHIDRNDFHRIVGVESSTMTAVLRSRPKSRFSMSFDLSSRVSRCHRTLEDRLQVLTDGRNAPAVKGT